MRVLNAKKGSVRSYELGLVSRAWTAFFKARDLVGVDTVNSFLAVFGRATGGWAGGAAAGVE